MGETQRVVGWEMIPSENLVELECTGMNVDWACFPSGVIDLRTWGPYGGKGTIELEVHDPNGIRQRCGESVELLTSQVSAKHTRRVSVKVRVVGLCSSGVSGPLRPFTPSA